MAKKLTDLDPKVMTLKDLEDLKVQPLVEDLKNVVFEFDRAEKVKGTGPGLRQAVYALEGLGPILEATNQKGSSQQLLKIHTILFQYRKRILRFIDEHYGSDFMK